MEYSKNKERKDNRNELWKEKIVPLWYIFYCHSDDIHMYFHNLSAIVGYDTRSIF